MSLLDLLNDTMRSAAVLAVGLLIALPAFAGPPGGAQEGVVKRAQTGDFFFVDFNYDKTFTGAADKKFRIQGGALTSALLIVGDFDGDGVDSVGLIDDSKAYIDADSSFTWAPAGGNELVNFFAPNVGMTDAVVGNFSGDTQQDFAKFEDAGRFFFVDANGNKLWDPASGDKKFRIQGGTIAGIPFACECFTAGQAVVGILADDKVYLDENRDFAWTPGAGTEEVQFFAPGVGATQFVVVGDWDNDGTEEIAKVAGNFIYIDRNGDFTFQAADDDKFRIQSGTIVGPYVAGDFDGANGAEVGVVDASKFYLDANNDGSWTPAGGDTATFFAPGQGTTLAVGAGVWQ